MPPGREQWSILTTQAVIKFCTLSYLRRRCRIPDWRELYDCAKVETNLQYLMRLLDEAEVAMWARLRELENTSNGEPERSQIKAAFNNMVTIRTEKLNSPDPLVFQPPGRSLTEAHLKCVSCGLEFDYSQINDVGMSAFFAPLTPDTVKGGVACCCPHCGFSALYKRTDLISRP